MRGGRTFNLLLPPPAASAAPEGIVLPPPKPRTDDTAGRVLLIFIDDLHFEPELYAARAQGWCSRSATR